MNYSKYYASALIALAGIMISTLISCGENTKREPAKKQKQSENPTETKAPEIDKQLTHNIQLIAGMDTLLDYDHPEWDLVKLREYAREVNAKFEKMQSTRLDKVLAWNRNNIQNSGNTNGSFCFYPFSGGDFVHAKWLYPEADEYLLVAMEEVGTIPDLTKASNEEVLEYLGSVDDVLRDIYKRSYFITKNMINDIRESNRVDGMFPIIMWAAARSNHEIVSIVYFDIDPSGNTTPIAPENVTAKSRAVEVEMIHKPTGKPKKITYLSADISDKGFGKHPGIKKFLENKVPSNCNSFVKSASYLMHYTTFSQIRKMVLDKSAILVQDDTGIPFDQLDQDTWNIELFGVYEKPVKDFAERLYQADLDSAYKNDKFYKGRLDFSLGYHWGSKNQNEMFIHRK